jgi:5,10-methylenetetrahydromethanopterin reductase
MQEMIAGAASSLHIDPKDTGIVVGAVTVVDEDGEVARELGRREVALYLPVIANLDPSITVEPEQLAGIRSAAVEYDFERAASFISDDLLRCFAFVGTPDEVAAQAAALFEAGASRVEFGTPHGLFPEEGLRLLGQQVLPALEEYREG